MFLVVSPQTTTGQAGSVIVSQYGSSKITVFEWGKNTIPKLLVNTKIIMVNETYSTVSSCCP